MDASLQKLSIGNQKCDNSDDDYGDMFSMCRSCFVGNTKSLVLPFVVLFRYKIKRTLLF